MPTQEERLTDLEKTFAVFRQEAGAHIKETEENTTIMLGVMRSQGQDIRKIFQRLETIDEYLNAVDSRLETVDSRLETVGSHLETVDSRLETVGSHLETVDSRLGTIEQRFDRLETRFDEHTSLLTQILARLPKAP